MLQVKLIAPDLLVREAAFSRSVADRCLYLRYLDGIRKLRAQFCASAGVKRENWQSDGGNEESWHVVLTDEGDSVVGCFRAFVYQSFVAYHKLRVSRSGVARDRLWAAKVQMAVERDLTSARQQRARYVELEGWALNQTYPVKRLDDLFLAFHALEQAWGGCLGLCIVSTGELARILRGAGAMAMELQDTPFAVHCDQQGEYTELVRFGRAACPPMFKRRVELLRQQLTESAVITPGAPQPLWSSAGWNKQQGTEPLRGAVPAGKSTRQASTAFERLASTLKIGI